MRMRNTYATLERDVGMDYRSIASELNKIGDPVGHSTVRNVILRVLERFAVAIMASYGATGDPQRVARDPGFQRGLASLVRDASEINDDEVKNIS